MSQDKVETEAEKNHRETEIRRLQETKGLSWEDASDLYHQLMEKHRSRRPVPSGLRHRRIKNLRI